MSSLNSKDLIWNSANVCIVEDGESGEATLLQMRAKLFALASKETGWKERGTGTLKVNVPKSCVNYDPNGVPVSGSFDLSGLEEDEGEPSTAVPRLIMRQDSTHRIILNTAISKLMEFQDKPTTSGAQVMFTAFEGDKEPKPIQLLLRVSHFLIYGSLLHLPLVFFKRLKTLQFSEL
jgi:DEAD/DEAH box helicase domain-containing protein